MYKYMLDDSHDEYTTYVNLITSPAGHYLSRRPYVIGLIKELLTINTLVGERMVIEQDMKRDIGTNDVVPTSERDTIYYAQPLKSAVYSRFARNRAPQTSSVLTVIIGRDSEGNYEVLDTWIGANHPAFPGDEQATPDSTTFWQTHALVQDAQVIQSKSVTKVCPYEAHPPL